MEMSPQEAALQKEQEGADKSEEVPEGFEQAVPAEDTLKAMAAMAERYAGLVARAEAISEQAKAVGVELEALDKEMVAALRGANMTNFKHETGRYQLDHQTAVSVLAENRDAVKDWLRAHPVGADLIKVEEQFSAGSLKTFIKELRAKGQTWPEDKIKIVDFTRIKRVPPKR